MRKLIALAVLALTMSVVALGSTPTTAATVRWVDDNEPTPGVPTPNGTGCAPDAGYTTISAAVAASSAGDTIKVCAGFYNEQVTINNKNNLTLLGAQAGVDARTRPFVAANESIINNDCGPVQIEADNVTLDGFTVQGSTLPDPCFLSGIWMNPGSNAPDKGGAQILNDIVQNNISGIELDSTCAANPTLVQFNLIQNNSNPGPGSGNGIQTNFGLCNATIDRNKFSGDTSSSVLVFGPPVSAVASNIKVSNNELVAGTMESIAFLGVSNSTITGNVSTGSTSDGTLQLFGGNSGVTVTSNTLLNGIRGIVVSNPFSSFGIGPNSNISAHQNCIQGNSVAGMAVDAGAYPTTPQLNAENNWWGSPTGPTNASNPGGTGDAVIDPDNNVDFTPFLTSPPGPPCPQLPTPGKVTGGGQIQGDPVFSPVGELLSVPALAPSQANPNAKATFGFVVKCCPATGNLEYNDHDAGVRIKAQSFSGLFIGNGPCGANTHAKFTGTADVIRATGTTSEPFTVNVDDCGEPGVADQFGIQTTTYCNPVACSGTNTLIGGNIQIHKQ